MPVKKKTYNDLSNETVKRNLILSIHKKIMECGKCDEGFIVTKGDACYCQCCKDEMLQLKQYKKTEIEVFDQEYDDYTKNKKDIYFRDENGNIIAEPTLCKECNSYFKTILKGRTTCDKCFNH